MGEKSENERARGRERVEDGGGVTVTLRSRETRMDGWKRISWADGWMDGWMERWMNSDRLG